MKKSYMDRENILSEGIFSKLKRLLGLSTSEEKELKKNKAAARKISNILTDLNKGVVDFEKTVNSMYRDMGMDKRVNVKRWKVTDFLK